MLKTAEEIVQRYFSLHLGRDLPTIRSGKIALVSSDRRLRPERGWAKAEAVWIHVFDRRAIVSARPDLVNVLNELLVDCSDPEDLLLLDWRTKMSQALEIERVPGFSHVLYCKPENLRIFKCDGLRKLEPADINAFVEMTLAMYPACDPECLAKDIRRNIQDGIAFGVFQKDALVCVVEAPIVAHMQDEVEEIGVNTLPEYRGRGCGRTVVSHATRAILKIGRVPIYRCSASNEPYQYALPQQSDI